MYRMPEFREKQELDELRNSVHRVTKELNLEEGTTDYTDSISFDSSMTSLVQLLNEGRKISSFKLTRVLVPLIHKIFHAENAASFDKDEVLALFNNPDLALSHIKTLHRLREVGVVATALSAIQKVFRGDCILNTDEKRSALSENKLLLQYRLSISGNIASKELENLNKQIKQAEQETEQAQKFCEQFKI